MYSSQNIHTCFRFISASPCILAAYLRLRDEVYGLSDVGTVNPLELSPETQARDAARKKKQRRRRIRRIIKWIVVLAVLAGAAYGVWMYLDAQAQREAAASTSGYVQTPVRRGALEVTVYGSGMIQAASQPNVLAETDGTLTDLRVSIGDTVQAGDVLAVMENSDLLEEITSLEYSLWSLDNSITSSLVTGEVNSIRAPASGRVMQVSAKAGDDALAVYREQGNVAVLSTDGRMKATFAVPEDTQLALGDSLTLRGDGFAHEGTVTDLIMKGTQATVTILDDNLPMNAPVTVETKDGALIAESTLEINKPMMVSAFGGTVREVRVSVGDQISQQYTMFTLDDAPNSLETENLRIQRESAAESLAGAVAKREALIVTAPVDGVIATLNVAQGDSITRGAPMLSILEGEEMVLTIAVDELDVVQVAEGQPVTISVDALPDLSIEGTVDRISPVGTGSGGVTSYDVLLNFSAAGTGVRAGMNASGEVQVAHAEDALYVPVEALMTIGNQSYVMVAMTEAAEAGGSMPQSQMEDSGAEMPQREARNAEAYAGESGAPPAGMSGQGSSERPANRQMMGSGDGSGAPQMMAQMQSSSLAVTGSELRQVTTGLSNDDYVEILSGLSAGELVMYETTSTSSGGNSSFGGGSSGMNMRTTGVSLIGF